MKYLFLTLFLGSTLLLHAQRPVVRDGEEQEKALAYPMRQKAHGDVETQIQNLQFVQAEEIISKSIATAKRKRKNTTDLEKQMEQCLRGTQMLRATDKVTVIDSVVVDKRNFLSGYKCPADLGTIRMSKDGKSTDFVTERNNHIYKVESADGKLQLVSYDIENGKQINRKPLDGMDVDGDLNYPFLMTDGITLYFAARSDEGLGNYDLFVTRYDYDEDKFYRAENLGFPYNSYANDYLMVVDDEHKIGWFASDRYQPNGKVCIYTFIPNASRHPYDYENDDLKEIISAASLRSYKSTWNKENEQARIHARQTLTLLSEYSVQKKPYDFTLVINDNFTYHYYSDFRSADAKRLCREWVQKQETLEKLNRQLDALRSQYALADKNKKRSMKASVIDMERQINKLTEEVYIAEKNTRNMEQK